MNRRYIGYLLYGIIGVGLNAYAFQNNSSLILIGFSVLSMPLLILTVEKFTRRFDFPLFFIRDELNWWGGAFGGTTALFFYIIGFLSGSSLSGLNFISFIFLLTTGFMLVLVLYTATILRDIELGYIQVNSEGSE